VEHIEAPQPVHRKRSDSLGDPSGVAKLSAEEPDALMHARPGPWEPWRVTARATQPGVRNAECQIALGVSARRALETSACARLSI
jgi:hypothetical protein